MDREYWEIRLQAYVDNELEPADRKAVESYMDEHPDFRQQAQALLALKSRLQVHAADVQIPAAVEARLQGLFDAQGVVKPKRQRNMNLFYSIAAMAAVIMLAILTPNVLKKPYAFQDTVVAGKVICPGCVIAERTGLAKNDLCASGHVLGIETDEGALYRFADDAASQPYRSDWSFYNKRVRVSGLLLETERLLRVDNLQQLDTKSAHFHPPGHSMPSHSVVLAP